MYKKLFFWIAFCSLGSLFSQELNCKIVINSDLIQSSNRQIYNTLQRALSEFVNQNKWTNRDVSTAERINCVMAININAQPTPNNFEASIQVQSSRPIHGTVYASPILNLRDDDFNFTYKEFDPLQFNQNSFDSNLISTIVYYVYVILGLDADTFSPKGGQEYLKAAQNVMLQAQQSGLAAWSNKVGSPNRFLLIDDLLSPKLQNFRTAFYSYHRKGFDMMLENQKTALQQIENSIISLDKLFNKSVGNYLLRVFFDAKSDEIVNIYSEKTNTKNTNQLQVVLNRISPANVRKWKKIKN